MAPMSNAFVASIKAFCASNDIPVVAFRKGERKDDVAAPYFAGFEGDEGVVLVGVAQEKTRVVRTQTRRNPRTGRSYAWLYRSTAMINAYYFYCLDRDFGPIFMKFTSYFPYNAKVCINGHECLKRQLDRRGIAHQALDNGIASCSHPRTVQRLGRSLSAAKIEALVRRWLRLLPSPLRPGGSRRRISLRHLHTAVRVLLDPGAGPPLTGRVFFEEVIRENLDVGRPGKIALVFDAGS